MIPCALVLLGLGLHAASTPKVDALDPAYGAFDGLGIARVDTVRVVSGRTEIAGTWLFNLMGAGGGADRFTLHCPTDPGPACDPVAVMDTLVLPWNGPRRPAVLQLSSCASRFRLHLNRVPALPMAWNHVDFRIRNNRYTVVPLELEVPPTDPRPIERLVVARPTRGVIYWNGHRLEAPFELKLAFRAGSESTFVATYVDSLPLEVQPGPIPRRRFDGIEYGKSVAQNILLGRARQAFREAKAQGLGLEERIAREARVLRADSKLVDSVLVGDGSLEIHWHGEDDVDRRIYSGSSGSYVPPISDSFRRVETYATVLDAGGTLVWFRGHSTLFPRGRTQEFESDLERKRNGLALERDRFSADEWEQLLHPRPIHELLRMYVLP